MMQAYKYGSSNGTLHSPYLCLPEVVHHWQHHEYCIIGSAGCEGSNPDSCVKTTMAYCMNEGDHAEEDEEELSEYK